MTVSPEIFYLAAGIVAGLIIGMAAGFLIFRRQAREQCKNRQQSADETVRPVLDALEKFERQVHAMEQVRQNAYGSLTQQVSSLVRSQQELYRETGKLTRALRQPQVRGRWGEITLRRVAEIAGMQNHCDFYEQSAADTEQGILRPDMIVRLPGKRQIVIDSKAPLSAYLDSLENESAEQARHALEQHADQLKDHIHRLAQKSYWRRFDPTPEFVVLFIPGENFFSAALSLRPGLIEEGAARGVIMATPTTLIALLKTVAYAWRQETAVENARAAIRLGSELYSRVYTMTEHFNRLGKDLDRCVSDYNKTVGSLERRVLASARKFREMGVVEEDRRKMDTPDNIDNKPRQMETRDSDEIENS